MLQTGYQICSTWSSLTVGQTLDLLTQVESVIDKMANAVEAAQGRSALFWKLDDALTLLQHADDQAQGFKASDYADDSMLLPLPFNKVTRADLCSTIGVIENTYGVLPALGVPYTQELADVWYAYQVYKAKLTRDTPPAKPAPLSMTATPKPTMTTPSTQPTARPNALLPVQPAKTSNMAMLYGFGGVLAVGVFLYGVRRLFHRDALH